jgi:hypothetical protein
MVVVREKGGCVYCTHLALRVVPVYLHLGLTDLRNTHPTEMLPMFGTRGQVRNYKGVTK